MGGSTKHQKSTRSTPRLTCCNCNREFKNEKSVARYFINVEDELYTNLSLNAIQVWDAIAFIYRISWTEFQNYLRKNNKKRFLSSLITTESIAMCKSCISLLMKNYKARQEFESSTAVLSLVQQVINSSRKDSAEGSLTDSSSESNFSADIDTNVKIEFSEEEIKTEPFDDYGTDENVYEEEQFEEDDKGNKTESTLTPTVDDSVDREDEKSIDNTNGCLNKTENVVKPARNILTTLKRRQKIRSKWLRERASWSEKFKNTKVASSSDLVSSTKKDSKKSKKEITCIICQKSFPSLTILTKEHSPEHAKDPTCPICCKKFSGVNVLRCHVKYAHKKRKREIPEEKPVREFKCGVCQKIFDSSDALFKKHMPRHSKDPTCPICGKKYSCAKVLLNHVKFVHKKGKKDELETPCSICGKLYTSKGLRDHMRLHGERIQYKCQVCGVEYLSKLTLDEHLASHSPNFIPHQCRHCSKTFKSERTLVIHEKMHTDVLPKKFSCDLCPAKFHSKGNLIAHAVVHTQDRPFKCDECGKTFKVQRNLNQHLEVHKEIAEKGEYSFKCDDCAAIFKHSKGLRDHRRRNHLQKRTYQCSFCGKSLSKPGSLVKHEELHRHNPNYQPRKVQNWKEPPNSRFAIPNSTPS